jgi:hypothetical protein
MEHKRHDQVINPWHARNDPSIVGCYTALGLLALRTRDGSYFVRAGDYCTVVLTHG